MTFSDLNLNKQLLNALDDMGIETPTRIQEATFSTIMSGRDVIGIAQTGTGKTIAYLLPLLRLWKFSKERHPQILIIVPTRELVEQVLETAQQLTEYTNAHIVGVYGGKNIKRDIESVEMGCDVLVATPGRLIDLCLKGALKLKNARKLVIDEVDEMLELGFRHQLLHIFDLLPKRRQNLLFSATMTEQVEELIEEYFNLPEVIEAAPVGTPLENIDQSAYTLPNFKSKVNLLNHLLSSDASMNKVLIFCATKKWADTLYEALEPDHPEQVGVIHSNKTQNYRFRSVSDFASGELRLLIATDIIARGIDISEVSHVVNFDMPETAEGYMHRIGRTGRAGAQGIALSFITEDDAEMRAEIEELMTQQIPDVDIPEEVELTEELLLAEMPTIMMKNQLTKGPQVQLGKAFEAKKRVPSPPKETRKDRKKRY